MNAVRAAEIMRRIGQPLDRGAIQPARHRRFARQRIRQRNALGQRRIAGVLHHVMRLAAADMRREPHHHRLGHDQPAGQVEVAPHARGVDHHALGDRAGVQQRAVRQHEGLRQREQLGLPRSGGALVVGRHGAEHHRHQRVHGARGGQDVFAGDRVALLRHGGRGAAAGDVGFRQFAHLGLRQQDDVGGELRQAAADQAEEGDRLGEARRG